MCRTPQQPGEAQAPQATGELEELVRGLHRRRLGSPQAVTAVMCICARLFDEALVIQFNREPVACEEASATSAHPQHHHKMAGSSPSVCTTVMCTIPPFKTVLAHPWGLSSKS